MTHMTDWSWKLKIAAGVVGMSFGTFGVHAAHTGATEEPYIRSHTESESNRDSRIHERRVIEADSCRATNDHAHDDGDSHHDDGRGRTSLRGGRNDDGSSDDRGGGDDHHHHPGPNPPPSGMLQQILTVGVHPTDLLKVDRRGRVIAAATNTGCVPRQGDDVFLFRPDGSGVLTTSFDFVSCRWMGNFSIRGLYQPQDCTGEHGGHD